MEPFYARMPWTWRRRWIGHPPRRPWLGRPGRARRTPGARRCRGGRPRSRGMSGGDIRRAGEDVSIASGEGSRYTLHPPPFCFLSFFFLALSVCLSFFEYLITNRDRPIGGGAACLPLSLTYQPLHGKNGSHRNVGNGQLTSHRLVPRDEACLRALRKDRVEV